MSNEKKSSANAWRWLSPVGPLTTIPMLLLFAVGLLVPEKILDTSPAAAQIVQVVHRSLIHISGLADINRFANSTMYPQVALLVASLHWMFLPFQALVMMALTEAGIRKSRWKFWKASRDGVGRVGAKDLTIAFVGIPAFLCCLVVATMVPGDWSLANGLTTGSRLGMSITFLIVFWLTALISNGVYAIARAFFDINIRGR